MSKDKSNDQVLEEKTLEEAFTELDGLADRLEDQEISLEDSLPVVQTGDGLVESFAARNWILWRKRCCRSMRMGHSVNFQK